jgi:magnesium transporter
MANNHHRRKRHRHVRRRSKPGALPGTIAPDPQSLHPEMQAFLYGKDKFVERDNVQLAEVSTLLGQQAVLWLNIDGLGDAATIEAIGNVFRFHRLALEDVVNQHQRPKVDDYGDYLFIVVRMVHGVDPVTSEQLCIFLGPNYVVTFQDLPGDSLGPVRERLRQATGKIREQGPDYLAYSLLDATIDGYYPVIEAISDRLELIEDEALAGGDENTMHKLRMMKHELMTVRRSIWPQREALGLLIRESHAQISAETRIYLRDCYDHVVQLIDLIEVYRELSMDLRDFYMSTVSNRINETMRVLTIVSTIFIPMTFIAGVYGMNFKTEVSPWNMPELGWYFGYPFSLALMLGTVTFMLVYFRRQGWIRMRWLFPPRQPPPKAE